MKKEFKFNKNNKIELTKEQLKSLLDQTYWEGYKNGSSTIWTYTTPNYIPSIWTNATSAASSTITYDSVSNSIISTLTNTENKL